MFIPLPYCVYVLFSEKDYMLYTGYTSDLNKRMQQHHNGESPNTSNRLPIKLIFCDYYYFKKMQHEEKIILNQLQVKRH